ncbi:MAG: hypothetical protein IPI83_07630 [Sphingomonadales bacterium]|nr:hypothetical protein [Sphingomonadales bacterium]
MMVLVPALPEQFAVAIDLGNAYLLGKGIPGLEDHHERPVPVKCHTRWVHIANKRSAGEFRKVAEQLIGIDFPTVQHLSLAIDDPGHAAIFRAALHELERPTGYQQIFGTGSDRASQQRARQRPWDQAR